MDSASGNACSASVDPSSGTIRDRMEVESNTTNLLGSLPAELSINRAEASQRGAQGNQPDKGKIFPGRGQSSVEPQDQYAYDQARGAFDTTEVAGHGFLL